MPSQNVINTGKPIEVSNGGTGATTLTNHGVVLGQGTAALTATAVGATGQTIMGNTGADPSFTGSPSFSGSVTAATGLTVTTGGASITGTTTISGSNNAVTITSGTSALNIANDAAAGTVNFATGAAVKTVTLGSTNSTSSTAIQSGSGTLSLTSTNGAMTLVSGTGAINISNDASATTVNIATGAAAKVVILGSTNGASSLALQYGTADFSLASATGTIMTAQDTGEINYPLQPAFVAYNSADDNDVTGDGTVYTIIFDTEIFDQGSDYNNTTGTFTAPITGRYGFQVGVRLKQLGASHLLGEVLLVTSNRSYQISLANYFSMSAAAVVNGDLTINGAAFSDMDVGDTASISVTVYNSTKTVDVFGTTSPRTFFSGNLVC